MLRGKFLLFLSFFLFVCSSSKSMIWVLKQEGENKKFAFTYKRIRFTKNGPILRYELKRFEENGKIETKVYVENKNGAPVLLENYEFPRHIKLALLERINKNNDSKKHSAQ